MNRIASYLADWSHVITQAATAPPRANWLSEIEAEEILELLEGWQQLATSLAAEDLAAEDLSEGGLVEGGLVEDEPGKSTPSRRQAWEEQLPLAMEPLLHAVQKQGVKLRRPELSDSLVKSIAQFYAVAPPRVRPALLEMLTRLGEPGALELFAELVVETPPADGRDLDRAFIPLFQNRAIETTRLFPRLLDGLQQAGLATAILDLANYLTRSGRVSTHPAEERVSHLTTLLGLLLERLTGLEQLMRRGEEPEDAAQQVNDGVGLGVAVCDALGLIGDPLAIGKLYQASELEHRRLRVEASSALARLGEAAGRKKLVELARDPATRLRAVQYADELECIDEIAPEFRSARALAEAELAAWLAAPLQFGMPPTQLQLFDERTLAWPGFDEPQECFLFQFEYRIAERLYANVGIAGPLAHAFLPDLRDLPPKDLYAAFAGWQATHPEIREISLGQLEDPRWQVTRQTLEGELRAQGWQEEQWLALGIFFGEEVFIGEATRDDQRGAVALSRQHQVWFPHREAHRPLTPEIAFAIFKGRLLLEQFNPDFHSEG